MSLDVAILGEDERPMRSVPISVDHHHRLLGAADKLGLPLMSRLSDYYADATIGVGELPEFLAEIARIKTPLVIDDPLSPTLDDLQVLTEEAIRMGRSLEAIAD